MTWDRTIPQLKRFVEDGGTLLAIGDATAIAERIGLPVTSALTAVDARADPAADGVGVLRARLGPARERRQHDAARLRVRARGGRVLRQQPRLPSARDAAPRGVRRVAWYESATPLRSGWAWGQKHLEGGVAVVDARCRPGRVLLFGPEINYRAQPHGTFKFLFNGIHYARAVPARLPSAASTR